MRLITSYLHLLDMQWFSNSLTVRAMISSLLMLEIFPVSFSCSNNFN